MPSVNFINNCPQAWYSTNVAKGAVFLYSYLIYLTNIYAEILLHNLGCKFDIGCHSLAHFYQLLCAKKLWKFFIQKLFCFGTKMMIFSDICTLTFSVDFRWESLFRVLRTKLLVVSFVMVFIDVSYVSDSVFFSRSNHKKMAKVISTI